MVLSSFTCCNFNDKIPLSKGKNIFIYKKIDKILNEEDNKTNNNKYNDNKDFIISNINTNKKDEIDKENSNYNDENIYYENINLYYFNYYSYLKDISKINLNSIFNKIYNIN